jgi:erythromycin esterase-like protein
MEVTFRVSFPGLDNAEAGVSAANLAEWLNDVDPRVTAKCTRADPANMDFGTVLTVVLAAPASVTVANALNTWLRRRNIGRITLHNRNGDLIVENMTAAQTAKLAEKMLAGALER